MFYSWIEKNCCSTICITAQQNIGMISCNNIVMKFYTILFIFSDWYFVLILTVKSVMAIWLNCTYEFSCISFTMEFDFQICAHATFLCLSTLYSIGNVMYMGFGLFSSGLIPFKLHSLSFSFPLCQFYYNTVLLDHLSIYHVIAVLILGTLTKRSGKNEAALVNETDTIVDEDMYPCNYNESSYK